ncbi:MAG: GlsB/YeaQ/YmgE family stress response membrane protein [Thermoanaerobaculia bacterium]
MSWIVSLIIGGVIGWLASIIMKTNRQMGILANMAVGVIGSILGNWIAGALGFAAFGSIARFLIALAGAVLLIVILRALGFFKGKK